MPAAHANGVAHAYIEPSSLLPSTLVDKAGKVEEYWLRVSILQKWDFMMFGNIYKAPLFNHNSNCRFFQDSATPL